MSKLDFFCNRPTLVALIGFGLDVSSAGSELTGNSEVNENYRPSSPDEDKVHELSESKEKIEDSGRSFIKGLLGYGKGRVVFHLNMNVGSVRVFLNKEDNTQLAMLVQESFLFDLKVSRVFCSHQFYLVFNTPMHVVYILLCSLFARVSDYPSHCFRACSHECFSVNCYTSS